MERVKEGDKARERERGRRREREGDVETVVEGERVRGGGVREGGRR